MRVDKMKLQYFIQNLTSYSIQDAKLHIKFSFDKKNHFFYLFIYENKNSIFDNEFKK